MLEAQQADSLYYSLFNLVFIAMTTSFLTLYMVIIIIRILYFLDDDQIRNGHGRGARGRGAAVEVIGVEGVVGILLVPPHLFQRNREPQEFYQVSLVQQCHYNNKSVQVKIAIEMNSNK